MEAYLLEHEAVFAHVTLHGRFVEVGLEGFKDERLVFDQRFAQRLQRRKAKIRAARGPAFKVGALSGDQGGKIHASTSRVGRSFPRLGGAGAQGFGGRFRKGGERGAARRGAVEHRRGQQKPRGF